MAVAVAMQSQIFAKPMSRSLSEVCMWYTTDWRAHVVNYDKCRYDQLKAALASKAPEMAVQGRSVGPFPSLSVPQ